MTTRTLEHNRPDHYLIIREKQLIKSIIIFLALIVGVIGFAFMFY